jgi:hypothetical protein
LKSIDGRRLSFAAVPITGLLVLLAGFPGLGESAPDDGAMEYRITIGEGLHRLSVELCFGATVPASLLASDALSNDIKDITATLADGATKDLRIDKRRIELPSDAVRCVGYTVRLPGGRNGDWHAELIEYDGALAVPFERILLRPSAPEHWLRTRLGFSAPPGVAVSAPGAVLPTNGGLQSFEFLDRPSAWTGSIALGQLTQSVVETGGARIRLSVMGDTLPETAAALHTWITTGVAAVATLYGRFPVSDLQVLVFPLGHNSDPVPWGEVVRGGGDAVHLYVDGTRSAAELNDNWVLSHELSHLIHPYVSAADAWLPEGIASYYQNVLRARAGLIDASVAWQKLDAGFKRGMAQFTSERSLARDTDTMMRERQYMRVYWSGAAIALIGDVDLRRRSRGAVSLDTVFEELSRCCLPSRRRWQARELMARMDEIAGYAVFVPLYERYVMRPVFPDLEETYRRLGLDGDAASLDPSGDAAAGLLRARIMHGPPVPIRFSGTGSMKSIESGTRSKSGPGWARRNPNPAP